jgi:hypothetical protein
MIVDVCQEYVRMSIPLGLEGQTLGKLQHIYFNAKGNTLDVIFSRTTEINSFTTSIECQPKKCETNSRHSVRNIPTTDLPLR